MLPQEVKEKIDAAMTLIYLYGENRDDVLDNLNAQVSHLIDARNEADFLEYRFEAESLHTQ